MRSKRHLSDLAKYVYSTVTSFGVQVSPVSRLGQMHRLFVKPDGSPPPFIPSTHPDFAVACEACRDLCQLGFISDELGEGCTPVDMRDRVRRLVRDAALPQDNKTDSRGRDEQCELYVAGICAKAGLCPAFAEPDIVCQFRGERLGIAVKRIKSLKRLQERIKGAAEQISRAAMSGVIAIDMTMAFNPNNEPFIARVSNDIYTEAAIAALRQFISDYFAQFVSWTQGARVRGIAVMYHDIRQDPAGGWSLESVNVTAPVSPFNQRRRREFEAFAEQFFRGLATQPIQAAPA